MPPDSSLQCARTANGAELLHLAEPAGSELDNCMTQRGAHLFRIVQQHLGDTKPGRSKLRLRLTDVVRTGSTANLVTASSPCLFKQTLPSGTLNSVRTVVILHTYAYIQSAGSHAVFQFGELIRWQRSVSKSSSILPIPKLAFICAFVMAMVGRKSTTQLLVERCSALSAVETHCFLFP